MTAPNGNPYSPRPGAKHYDPMSDDIIRESAWDEGRAAAFADIRALLESDEAVAVAHRVLRRRWDGERLPPKMTRDALAAVAALLDEGKPTYQPTYQVIENPDMEASDSAWREGKPAA